MRKGTSNLYIDESGGGMCPFSPVAHCNSMHVYPGDSDKRKNSVSSRRDDKLRFPPDTEISRLLVYLGFTVADYDRDREKRAPTGP